MLYYILRKGELRLQMELFAYQLILRYDYADYSDESYGITRLVEMWKRETQESEKM